MIIPSGYTEQQVLSQINVVVNRIASKYTFHGYVVDDIKQEAFIICMDALSRYEPGRPLENFLSVNLSNRLKNFVRDNYYTVGDNAERIKTVCPAQLSLDNQVIDSLSLYYNDYCLDYAEMVSVINMKLPASMRADYLKIINDVYVPKGRREDVVEEIKEILAEHRLYEKG